MKKKIQVKRNKKEIMKKVKPEFDSADQLSRIELYKRLDQNNPLNQGMRPYEGFNGPKKERSMTDRLCLVFLLVFFCATVFHGIVLISYGNINRISNGYDFRDEICGINGLINLPYLYYLQPSVDMNVAMCVDECPSSTGKYTCLYSIDHFTTTNFCYVQMSSTKMARYCIPKEPVSRKIVDDYLSQTEPYIKRTMSDILLSLDLIIASIVLLGASAYFLTYLLSFPSIVKFQVWGQIWLSIICFGILSYLFYREYERVIDTRCLYKIDKHQCGGDRATLFYLAWIGTAGIGLLFLFNIMKLFNKINLGISLIKTSAQIVLVLKQLRFFAIFVAFIGFVQLGYSCIVIFYGMTIGERSTVQALNINGDAVKIFTTTQIYQLSLPFQAFMILFFLLFVMSVNEMFNTYALSVWFFTKRKDVVQIPLLVVLRELLLHHLGSCVYAVFMEIFFFIPKWIFYTIYYFLSSLPQDSMIVRFIQGCCLCCLACYQNCLRYLSKHALVQVAIWSEGYSASSRKAYFLLDRHKEKIHDLDFLIEFILFLLKLSNSLVISLPIYIYLSVSDTTLLGVKVADIESPLIPTLFVFLIGFFYVSVFQVSYDITTKSVIQLYLVDREMFYGEQRFVEDFIQKFMEFYGKKEADQIKIKSNAQRKYNAQVVPENINKELDEQSYQSEEQEEEEDEDEEEEEELEDINLQDDNSSPDLGNNYNGKNKTNAHHIVADPFQLDDASDSRSQTQWKSGTNFHK